MKNNLPRKITMYDGKKEVILEKDLSIPELLLDIYKLALMTKMYDYTIRGLDTAINIIKK